MISSKHLPDTVTRPHEWAQHALCRSPAADPAWWEADRGDSPEGEVAVAWCGRCPVRKECRAEIERIEEGRPVTEVRGIVAGLDADARKRGRARRTGDGGCSP